MQCEMTSDCAVSASYIDEKGYIYCEHHGQLRRSVMRCRKLTESEMHRIETLGAIKGY